MRVAVVHYHYRPGGVTRVVENAFESIQGRNITAVAICGEPYQGGKMPVRLQPGLRYSQANEKLSPGPLWYALKMTARQALGGEPDVWHFHNPALGKNSAMAEVVGKMAADAPVLLQFHDFAEDGRPANYAMLRERMENIAKLYPQAPQVHYATLNARDQAFLCDSGFNAANVHLLPNPVWLPQEGDGAAGEGAPGCAGSGLTQDAYAKHWASHTSPGGSSGGLDALQEGQPLYLYPTRGIRRKNLGEFLLWVALSAGQAQAPLFATTLAPENPAARPVYERWLAFSRELGLPVVFGAGEGRRAPSFAALMRRAQAVVSTSVAEGFGMAFLEPWLFGKPVLGRNLPEITADFAAQGVDLSSLYERLLVPEDLVDMQALRRRLGEQMARVYAAYHRTMPHDAVETCLRACGDGQGRIDFACLDEPLQEAVIAALRTSPQLRGELIPAALAANGNTAPQGNVAPQGNLAAQGGGATGAGADCGWQTTVAANAQAIKRHYGLAPYGERLAALYRQVADSPRMPLDYADPARVLDRFLAPERFRLLCS